MSDVEAREEDLQAALAMLAAAPGSSVAQALLADISEVGAGADVSGRGAWVALIGQLDAYVAGMDGEHEEALAGHAGRGSPDEGGREVVNSAHRHVGVRLAPRTMP